MVRGAAVAAVLVVSLAFSGATTLADTPPPPTPFPVPRHPTPPPRPVLTTAVTPPGPVTVVVGDVADFSVGTTTNDVFPLTTDATVAFTLPGQTGVCIGCISTVVEIVSTSVSTGGTCAQLLVCALGTIGGGADVTTRLQLRAKVPGSYSLLVHGMFGTPVTIPFTIVPRVADLGIDLLPGAVRVSVGAAVTRTLLVTNHGPHATPDAVVIVGSPRLASVRASVGGVACTPVPIRCPVGALEVGASKPVLIRVIGRRAGTTHIPLGVASKAAGDPVGVNSAGVLVVRVTPRHASR